MEFIFTVCARGGSQRLKGKNKLSFAGKPLIKHTIEQALRVKDQAVIVSTDSTDIMNISRVHDGIFIHERPAELATSKASKLDAIRDVVLWFDDFMGTKVRAKYIIDLAVTSPLRLDEDILHVMDMLRDSREYVKSANTRDWMVNDEGLCGTRMQLNGAITAWSRDSLFDGRWTIPALYTMPTIRSIDIDTIEDFLLAEAIYEKGLHYNFR
jgi:CMP-N-acetylneuraminic acid synthetase